MEELKELLLAQLASRPAMEIRDAVKLIYQNEFGGGHLIADPARAQAWLREELDACGETDAPLVEPIGNGMARVNLALARGRLTPETLFSMFSLSSAQVRGSMEAFCEKLALLYELGFEKEQVDAFLESYKKAGCPPLSHSDAYRAAYAPAYRVVSERYTRWMDVFSAVDRFSRFAGPVLIGVDGMCAAGKTTLGTALAEVFDANLFHADDFYLPQERRTPERMASPGGNMDRERLSREVLAPLSRHRDAVTRCYDCGTLEYGPWREFPYKRVNVVEGSYSLHPDLADTYTLKIAVRTAPETQLARLNVRGPDMLGSFISLWIPLENRYFAATGLWDRADMVIDT